MINRARIAVVGAGGIGAAAHLPAIAALSEQAELVGIVDLDDVRRAGAGEQFGTDKLYADLALMMQEQKPDIVVLATPPHTHEALAIQVMRAGAWVFCEKPMTGSLASVDRIAAVEEETGQACITVSQFRYSGGARQVRDKLRSGEWGSVLTGYANTSWYRGAEYWQTSWRGKFATEFAGASTTQAHHAIDLLLWLMGDWSSVAGFVATLDRPIEVEDASTAVVRFAGGGMATLLSQVLSHQQETRIQVTAQLVTIDLETLYMPLMDEWTVRQIDNEGHSKVLNDWAEPEGEKQAHREQLANILERWRSGQRPELSVTEARATIEFLTALYKSAATGTLVMRGDIVAGDPFYEAIDAGGPARAKDMI